MLVRNFRVSMAFAGLLAINTIVFAESKPAPAASKPAPAASKPAPAASKPAPAASKPAAPSNSAYVCNSKIGGTVPQIGPVHHSSVAICPAGQNPTTVQNGISVNNPKCTYYGTQPGTSTFQLETKRNDVSCKPAQAPAAVVQQRVNTFNQPYNLITNNCQQAASKVTKK